MKNWINILFLIPLVTFSQAEFKPIIEEIPSDTIYENNINFHSAIQPILKNSNVKNKYLLGRKFGQKDFYTSITALADVNYYQLKNQNRSGLGLSIENKISDKLFTRISAVGGVGQSYSKFIMPKSFYSYQKGDSTFEYFDLRGRISYSPNNFFNFQTGIDNHFIGEGCRSLLLSDYSVPAPFGQIRMNFWRLEYDVIYQFYREQKPNKNWKSKYATTHYLSYNVSKWLNIGVFESVVFIPQDTNLNRGFDAEYLNPIIFYRPQEYSLGSSDNSMMGAHFSAKYKGHTLYGQFMLDDFNVQELKAKSKWWANKYAIQIGIKGRYKTANYGDFFYRAECNIVRPYTYSHVSKYINYGNQGYALAHPYGANFEELIWEVKWQKNNFLVKGYLNYYFQGSELDDKLSYGNDIYESYDKRPLFQGTPIERGILIGYGLPNNGVHGIITLAYLLEKSKNLQFFIENHFRSNTKIKTQDYQLVIGIRTCLWNDYRNY